MPQVDIYGQGQRNASNQSMIDYLKALQTQMVGEQSDREQAGGGVYIGDEAQNQLNEKYMQQAAAKYGWSPEQIKGVNPSLLADVMQYNGVNDPTQAMQFLRQYTAGQPAGVATAGAGNRDGIAYALANGLGVDDARRFASDYQASHNNGAINGAIKAGVGTLFAMGAGNAAGLLDLGAAPGAVNGGTAMFSPEAAGAYQSFTAPTALTGVSAAPEIGATLGATGGAAAGTAMFAPEAGGAYQSFAAPEALTSVNAAPSVGASGLSQIKNLTTAGGLLKDAGTFLKDNKDIGLLAGGLLGAAAGKDTTISAQKDPWGPAQGYLKDNLAQNAAMQQYYQANPFSQEQKAAYQGLLDTNANGLANAGNYAQIANNFMQSNRGQMPTMPGLLTGQTAAPVNWAAYSNIGKK